jgi:hypothetical protein
VKAKREEHFESVAVGAAGLLRGHAVQYPFNQLPDAVLPQIAGWVTGTRAVGFTRRPHIRLPAGSAPLRRVRGEKAPEGRPVARSKAGGGARAPPYIGERFARPGYRGCPKRAGRPGASVVLGQIALVGGDYRNRGRGEGGLLELPVEVGPPDFSITQCLRSKSRVPSPASVAWANSRRSATWAKYRSARSSISSAMWALREGHGRKLQNRENRNLKTLEELAEKLIHPGLALDRNFDHYDFPARTRGQYLCSDPRGVEAAGCGVLQESCLR